MGAGSKQLWIHEESLAWTTQIENQPRTHYLSYTVDTLYLDMAIIETPHERHDISDHRQLNYLFISDSSG